MKHLYIMALVLGLACAGCLGCISCQGNSPKVLAGELTVKANDTMVFSPRYKNFILEGEAMGENGASASIFFHSNRYLNGYQVCFHNGIADGSIKTGSLKGVRNLYFSMVQDEEWFPFSISVQGNHISVSINHIEVVSYDQPQNPYRVGAFSENTLRHGMIALAGFANTFHFKNLTVQPLSDDIAWSNGQMASDSVDESKDPVIHLQQQLFPVIDYHVHLKGAMDKELAHKLSMQYGINYGIAPNCGIGFPIQTDQEVVSYMEENKQMPFFYGMQGEGREWPTTFTNTSRDLFDYVFTDSMTFLDQKGRRTRLWIDQEVIIDIPVQKYMDQIVEKTIKVLNEEPIDIYVNPTFLPTQMEKDYATLWTPERMDRVIQALLTNNIALEINARYRIPSFEFISAAKKAGVKFTFGTNNADENIGRLEYCMEAIQECGLTIEDLWFPNK